MDVGDYIWGAIVVYSLIKRIFNASGKKAEEGEKPPPQPRATRRVARGATTAPAAGRPARGSTATRAKSPPVATTAAELAARTSGGLHELIGRARELRARLDPTLERALGPLFAQQVEGTAERLLSDLDRAKSDAIRLSGVARAAGEESRAVTRLLATLEIIAARRADPALHAYHRAADRLVGAASVPLERRLVSEATSTTPPPVPLILDDDGSSPVYANFALLPSVIPTQPVLWANLAYALGLWVVRRADGLDQEVGVKLELDADATGDAGPERVARVLFGAWRATFLADAIAAQWLGPTYLRALSALLANVATPSRVVAVAVNRDGVVQPGPPSHVRIHLIGRWLVLSGTPESEVAPILAAWNAAHGEPEALRLTGEYRGSQIPLEPFFATTRALLERLQATPLTALGGGRLADLPGFDEPKKHAEAVAAAGAALAAKRPARRSPRAALAAAIDAALATPANGGDINAWFIRSTADAPPATRRALPAPSALSLRRGRINRNHAANALVLGELVLRPRWRSPGRP